MNREKLIETIKKLLALSNGAGATDAEKDLALNRAKDLMAQYAIGDVDISNSEKIKELIITLEYTPKLENPLPSYLFNPALFNTILTPIAQNFGCYVSFRLYANDLHDSKMTFYGFKANVEVAQYACDVLLNAGISDFRREYKEVRSIGFATTFWNGFAEGLHRRFTKLSNETAIVLYDKVKQKFEKEVHYVKVELPSSTEQSGRAAGLKSATEAQLHSGISNAKGNLLS